MHAHDQAELLLRMLSAPRRNHFFYGKRMDVQHFQLEQNYGKNKQWLLNRLTLGKGVLCGLKVSVDGDKLCVDPGVAIDGLGREIIVPVRSCLDPQAEHGGCCGGETSTTYPAQPPVDDHARDTNIPGTVRPHERPGDDASDHRGIQVFTLWLCYRECYADQQPVLVTDCETRSHCAPDTIVESFCLKVTPGMPPLQGDPDWCLRWAEGDRHDRPEPNPDPAHGNQPDPIRPFGERPPLNRGPMLHGANANHAVLARLGLKQEEIVAVLQSRRLALCTLLDKDCTPAEGDACVPLAVGLVRDRRIVAVESCLVRPRVYSNTVLLDLILCLAERVDACCKQHPQQLLRVESVSFLSVNPNGVETEVAKVQSPLDDLKIKISLRPNAIRVRFTDAFAQDAHMPSTHQHNDPDFKRHNVQVLPTDPLNGVEYVPGTLKIEDSRTIRFELFSDSPYVRNEPGGVFGWQKGRYQLMLFGDDDAAANRHAITDTAGSKLDGEKAAPANGAISGNGSAGGTFELTFIIG
jgi:hypothetical protein